MSLSLVDDRRRVSMPYHGQTVLIVDGDRSIAESLGRGLELQGYYTLMARSGEAAIEVAESAQPQLIVLDHRLPDMDAMTACERLAANPSTCHIPAIILSGMTRPDIIRRSRVSGAQYFVRKPYDSNALFFLIQHAIEETLQSVAG